MRSTASLRTALLGVVPVAGTFAAFLPITGAYFHRDDFLHLVAVNNHPLGEIVWRPFMGHLYVLPRLTYASLLAAAGPIPQPFFWLVLVLHLLNTALLFAVARRLAGSARIASVAALLWGTSALHTFTLSYFCLHAHVLVGLALLLILSGLARAERRARVSARQAVWWACLAFAASLSYGTGLVLALTLPVVATICLRHRLPRRQAIPLWLLPAAVAAVYGVARSAATASAYGAHRLDAGVRASLADPWPVLSMFGHLAGFALSTLAALPPALAPPYPSPASVTIGGALAVLLLSGCVLPSPRRNWIIALVLFAAACYAVTAVAPAYERQIFHLLPAVKAQDHRYHYAPSIALMLGLAMVAASHARRATLSPLVKDAACLLCYAAVLASFVVSPRRIDLHRWNRVEVAQALQRARQAAAAAPPGSTVRLDEARFRGGFGAWPSKLTTAAIVTLFYPDGEIDGRRVRWVAPADRAPLDAAPDSPWARAVERTAPPAAAPP